MESPDGVRRPWLWVATAGAGTACVLAAAAVALQFVLPGQPFSLTYWLVDALSAVAYSAVAWVMLPRTRHPGAWLLLVGGLGSAASALSTQLLRLYEDRPWLGGFELVDNLTYVGWMPGNLGAAAVLPWLVSAQTRGAARDRARGRTRAAAALLGTALVVATMAAYLTRWPWSTHVARATLVLGAVGSAYLVLLWWRQRHRDAARYAWLALAHLLMTAGYLVIYAVEFTGPLMEVSGVVLLGSVPLVPTVLLVVVARDRHWGLETAVSRGLLGMLLALTVIGTYIGLVWASVMLLPVDEEVARLAAAILVALATQPLRQWLQRRVDRMVYGTVRDPVILLAQLGSHLRGDAHGDGGLPMLVEGLCVALGLGGVAVVARTEPVVGAEVGDPAPGPHGRSSVTLPLVVDRRHVGDLTATAPGGQRLDRGTIAILRQCCDLVAVSLEREQVTARLQDASQRLGEVRHEERRMIRRELHDSVGPALAGLGLGLSAARMRLRRDPEGVDALLADLEAELAQRTDAVRHLSRALLPAQLDEGDLAAALDVLAERFVAAGLDVTVCCEEMQGLDARRQVAVYHVVAEALFNAHRHGRADTVRVGVTAGRQGGVLVEVVDDGVGISTTSRAGVGLRSMRERAEELGGTLDLGSGPDGRGTRVWMRLGQ